jgi:hypothetical protein
MVASSQRGQRAEAVKPAYQVQPDSLADIVASAPPSR